MASQPLSNDQTKISPMMVQWHACKKIAGDAVVFFRMGDFYEAFYDDAILLSKELDLTLTSRQDIPMSGIPHHTSEVYIDRLVSKGFRVAVAEQMEDPKKTKGLVKREIVRFVSPGTVINSSLLSEKTNNYFVALTHYGSVFGLACLDLTTSELVVSEFKEERDLLNELYRLHPTEFLASEKFKVKYQELFDELQQSYSFLVNGLPDWHFEQQSTQNFLTQHFQVFNLDGYGLQGMNAAVSAAGSLLRYIQDTLCLPIHHIQDIRLFSTSHFMSIDRITLRNLELTQSLQDRSRKNTLLDVLDHTQTSMGSRLMHQWIKQPLLSVEAIQQRHAGIGEFLEDSTRLETFRQQLSLVKDIERLITKVSAGYATARDLVALRFSFAPIGSLRALLSSYTTKWIQDEALKLDPLPNMTERIAQALVDEPALRIGEGKIFREGYHLELDQLQEISRDSKAWIATYQTRLRDETGIKTLKVGFNRMSGYYIEVSRGQTNRMPDSFTRRQTLVNAERYISPELKDYESKVLTAEERCIAIENELFSQLRAEIAQFSKAVMRVAQGISRLDCLSGLAEAAKLNNYCRPIVDNSQVLIIEGGRHPVIEQVCKKEKFVPNNTFMNSEDQRLLLITGPNMAGKSTYLRQVALITIMAQLGSYIPAQKAHIGIVDKVFTRIGASDDLSRGQSTFMVEMSETANILNNVSSHSLVILDEIGRGTSTYDGISLAWSIAEYLLKTPGKTAKTLFATHYWELTKLEDKNIGAVNYHFAINDEQSETMTFSRRMLRGGTDRSFGIYVAKLAGIPLAVIHRSQEILKHLEENSNRKHAFEQVQKRFSQQVNLHDKQFQLSLFEKKEIAIDQ